MEERYRERMPLLDVATDEEHRLTMECEKPPGQFRFMLIRGKEFEGRV